MPISKFHRLELDALIRALAVNRGRSLSMLMGAGASISSGMPSADRCIWEWKQDIFATNNPTLRESVGEISLAGTKRRIQEWLDRRGATLVVVALPSTRSLLRPVSPRLRIGAVSFSSM